MGSRRSRPTGARVKWGMCFKGSTQPFWLKRTVICWSYAATRYSFLRPILQESLDPLRKIFGETATLVVYVDLDGRP
jgi:hypothetical protein